MAVYYKFKSAKDYDSIPIDGHFISVLNLKEKIFETKHLGRGTDFDLVVTNAQTNEEYLDEAMLVPKNTSVLIRRVPGRPRMPIVTQEAIQQELNGEASIPDNAQPTNNNFVGAGSSVMKYTEDSEWDEFGNDLYAIPETLPVHASNPVQDAPPPNKDDEDSKIKALIDTPALDWQRQTDGFGAGRGFGRGMGGRMMGGRGFGRGGFERKTPPPGYVCHRCNQPGHFIQHCPTNGVPEFDVKRVKPPTGIPKSMLMATPEGSYALPSGAVAVLKPNEAAFEREIEGLPSNRPVGDLPPELRCPLCKEVMKDAVLTSKCCFTSFCDRCIRDQFITKSVCVCGANNVLADDLLPNKTVRDTINRILETNNSSTENGGSAFQVQDIESKMEHPRIQQKVPSPTHSAASKGNQTPPPQMENSAMVKETVGQSNSPAAPQNILEMGRMVNVPDVSEATRDLMTVKEHASQGNVPLADDEMQQKPVSGDAGKKKKKKKVRVPPNEMQWRNPQDVAMENYMMPMGPSGYNPYWNGMQPGMEGFLPPFGGPMPPFMGYGHGPLDVPFGLLPQDPFGVPNMMMHHPPFPPQRDLAEIGMGMGMNMGMGMGMRMGMGMNVGPPAMSREEFEARKADLRRKREMERRGERDLSRDREFSREMSSNGDVSSLRPKSRPRPPPSTDNHTTRYCHRSEQPSPPPEHRRHRSEQPSPPADHHRHRSEKQSPPPDRLELPRPSSKRKSSSNYDHHHHRSHRHRSEQPSPPTEHHPPPPSAATVAAATEAEMDRKHKASVFSRISFPTAEEQAAKKKTKKGSFVAEVAPPLPPISSSGHKGNGFYDDDVAVKRAAMESSEEEEEEEDRHFKRRPARYEPSPAPSEEREDGRHSRGRGRERSVRDGRERKHR